MALGNKRIKDTLQFWERRYPSPLTSEDARQINVNIAAFFSILKEWDAKDSQSESTTSDPGRS